MTASIQFRSPVSLTTSETAGPHPSQSIEERSIIGTSSQDGEMTLKGYIESARKKTAHNDWFIPYKNLRTILDRESVARRLTECGVPAENRDETLELVLTKAIKVFGILVQVEQESLVVDFISNDILDEKLPLSAELVEEIKVDARFLELQWEYVAPIFTKRSVTVKLKDRHILPFLEDQKLDGAHGGYANAFRVSLDPQHQDLEPVTEAGQVSS